jgi:hypothetical protein
MKLLQRMRFLEERGAAFAQTPLRGIQLFGRHPLAPFKLGRSCVCYHRVSHSPTLHKLVHLACTTRDASDAQQCEGVLLGARCAWLCVVA